MSPRTEPEAQMWVVWAPKEPKPGDTVYHAQLGEPIPRSTPTLPLRQPAAPAARKATRGTSNANDRGSAADRRARRAWLVVCYASDMPGYARCYRCGCLLFNPDDAAVADSQHANDAGAQPLTIDRIIPGCKGGTYRRSNIRPACGPCNSETGGALATTGRKKT